MAVPHISPTFCCGRQSARCRDKAYSLASRFNSAQGRFSAPSLPLPRQTASPRGRVATGRRLHSAHHRAAHTARPTNTTTARFVVSSAQFTSMSGRPGFAARRTLRPLSTAISRTNAARPGASARTATMRPWTAGPSGSTDAKSHAAGTKTSPPAPSPSRRDAWPRCRRTSSPRPSC